MSKPNFGTFAALQTLLFGTSIWRAHYKGESADCTMFGRPGSNEQRRRIARRRSQMNNQFEDMPESSGKESMDATMKGVP